MNNKYIAAEESTYGTTPDPFTSVDLGHIQSLTVSEEENMEKLGSINGGHTYNIFEDGLYWANVSIEILATKTSLPAILELCLGTKAEATDYTITSSTDYKSYSMKVSWTSDKILLINGFVVKDFDISAAKGESVSITMNGLAKKVTQATETLSTTKNTDDTFKDLDASVTVDGNATVLNSFNITGNWNITDDEGRGIESVAAGERRLLQCFVKHTLDVNGSYEAEVDNNLEAGYTEDRSDEAIVFTISRGTDNEHVFTMSNTRANGRELGLTTDNSKRVMSYDYEALDVGVTGDL